MRYAGRLTDWHDDKGYGFVVPHDGGDRAFVHIRAFERPGRRPAVGDLVSYAVERDARGRRNAVQVRFAGALPPPRKVARDGRSAGAHVSMRLRTPLALLAFAALALLAWRQLLPPVVLLVYAVASAAYGTEQAKRLGLACIAGTAMRRLPNGWEQLRDTQHRFLRCQDD